MSDYTRHDFLSRDEMHGMSQRGGSVESHLRFSPVDPIFFPTIPGGEVDVLLGFELLEALRVLVAPAFEIASELGEPRAANIVLLGGACPALGIEAAVMEEAVRLTVKPKALEVNLEGLRRGLELGADAAY